MKLTSTSFDIAYYMCEIAGNSVLTNIRLIPRGKVIMESMPVHLIIEEVRSFIRFAVIYGT